MSLALRISLGANLVLTVLVAILLWRAPAETAKRSATPASSTLSLSDAPATPTLETEALAPSAERKITPATLGQLEKLGLSRDLVVSALLEDFQRRWDKRFADLQKQYAPRQVPDRAYTELGRLRDADRIRELKEALGEAGYLAWDKEQTLRGLNAAGVAMTPEEAERAYRLQKEFEEKHQELQMAMEDGVADIADAGALQARAQEALEKELEKLFGKQRFDRMRGYNDPTEDIYRAYADLNPTPAQVSAVTVAERGYREREAALRERLKAGLTDPAAAVAEVAAMNQAREEELRRIFGAEGYEAMKRQNDPTYKTLRQYAQAWELNEQEIQSVYETMRTLQDQAERARTAAQWREAAGQPVNWLEITAAIDQAQQQTEATLQTLIGGDRLRRLKQNGVLTMR